MEGIWVAYKSVIQEGQGQQKLESSSGDKILYKSAWHRIRYE